jgi:hypothetical protein
VDSAEISAEYKSSAPICQFLSRDLPPCVQCYRTTFFQLVKMAEENLVAALCYDFLLKKDKSLADVFKTKTNSVSMSTELGERIVKLSERGPKNGVSQICVWHKNVLFELSMRWYFSNLG